MSELKQQSRVPVTLVGSPGDRRSAVRGMTAPPATRRARLHLRAADALVAAADPDDAAELLAEHLWAAASLGVGVRAAEALERAAEVAVRRAAFATAEELLQRALSLRRSAGTGLAETGHEFNTLMTLARVTRSLHGYSAVVPLLDRGKELAVRLGADDVLLNLEWAEWAAADTACDFSRADPIAERFRTMAEEAAPDDIVKHVVGHGVWGISCWHQGRIDESTAHLDRSRAAAANLTTEQLTGMVAEQTMLTELFSVAAHDLAGDLDAAGLAYEPLIRSKDDRFTRAMVAGLESGAATAVGDMARVMRVSRAGLAADPDGLFGFWGTMNQMYSAGASLVEGGDPDAAVAQFEDGHTNYRRAGSRSALGSLYATMAIELVSYLLAFGTSELVVVSEGYQTVSSDAPCRAD